MKQLSLILSIILLGFFVGGFLTLRGNPKKDKADIGNLHEYIGRQEQHLLWLKWAEDRDDSIFHIMQVSFDALKKAKDNFEQATILYDEMKQLAHFTYSNYPKLPPQPQ